ncbi:MAG: PD40 domain-containing protein [Bacteroidales bacterium]|nr:PD40 domain-containing protein [Bacteroidales bacterium]
MKKLLLVCLAALTVATNANADKLRFAYYPSLSPDGKTIYFSYNGDIYSVASEGGTARSTVNIGGYENRPLVSPNGEYLAFSSDTQGNGDVYIIKLKSGELKQLTYSEATDSPVSWSADSKYIYFESTRSGARKTSYRVRAEGGTPELMFEGYFNTVVNLVENPKTGEFLFNESTESINFPTRKGYVGDHNPNIKSWNPSNGTYKELSDYEGKDQWPMVDRKGNIYYVSDEFNKEGNIYKYVKGKEPLRLTGFDESVQYPSLSADGSAMVFLKDYAINLLDLSSGTTSEPEIIVNGSTVEVKRHFQEQKPSRAAVSPDGKKFALIIRGQLFVSDAKAKYLQKLDTPSKERVSEVLWGKDNKTIYTSPEQTGAGLTSTAFQETTVRRKD